MMNITELLENSMNNFTDYSQLYYYSTNRTDHNYSFNIDMEEVATVKQQRSKACEMHVKFQFAFVGCLAGILCIFGIFGNTISFLIFTRGRQKNAVVLMLRALAVADSLYLASYFGVQSWYQLPLYLGE